MKEAGKKKKIYVIFVMVSVIVLVIITLNYSYSAFFSIDSRNVVQEISTGTLNVSASATPMTSEDLFPTEEILPTSFDSKLTFPNKNFASLTISNYGNIDASYVITLSYDTTGLSDEQIKNDLISMDYLIIGIYDSDEVAWLNLNPDKDADPIYNMYVTQFNESESGIYPILKQEIAKASIDASDTIPNVKNLKIYVWLADTTPTTEIGKLAHLKINVKSVPLKGQADS